MKAVLAVRNECHILDHWDRHEWKVCGHRHETFATSKLASTTGKVYSECHIIIMVKRFHGWYVVVAAPGRHTPMGNKASLIVAIALRRYMANIGLFMASLVLASWSVFVMDPIDTADRMETAVSLVLAAISSKFVIAQEVPKISYQVWDHSMIASVVRSICLTWLFCRRPRMRSSPLASASLCL